MPNQDGAAIEQVVDKLGFAYPHLFHLGGYPLIEVGDVADISNR